MALKRLCDVCNDECSNMIGVPLLITTAVGVPSYKYRTNGNAAEIDLCEGCFNVVMAPAIAQYRTMITKMPDETGQVHMLATNDPNLEAEAEDAAQHVTLDPDKDAS